MANKKLEMTTLIETSVTGISENTPNTDPVENVVSETTNKKSDNDSLEKVTNPALSIEFNRANVEALGNKIRLVDSDEENKLDLFCYVKCSMTDSELLKQCRGVVFNGDKIVMKAFPYAPEYNHTEVEAISKLLSDFKEHSFYEAHEGALVRVFNFNGKWYVSTHRKLNAFKSKWASRESFGTLFKKGLESEYDRNPDFKAFLSEGENILDKFQNSLDKNKQYMFLICNNKDNRIVCSPPENPTVYHVGTFVDGKLVMDIDVKIPGPAKLSFTGTEDLLDFVKELDYKKLQGVICFSPNNVQTKILSKDYQDLFRARGNEPSIKFRYLQVRMKRRHTNMLYHLYPEMADVFDDYENTLYDIARNIYRAYVQRFIKKRYVTVPREEFAVIRECHRWHLANRTENRISIDQVIKVMNLQSPTHLNHMIRRFRAEKVRKQEKKDIRPRSDSIHSVNSNDSPVIKTAGHPSVSPMLLSKSHRQRPLKYQRVASIHSRGKPRYTKTKVPWGPPKLKTQEAKDFKEEKGRKSYPEGPEQRKPGS